MNPDHEVVSLAQRLVRTPSENLSVAMSDPTPGRPNVRPALGVKAIVAMARLLTLDVFSSTEPRHPLLGSPTASVNTIARRRGAGRGDADVRFGSAVAGGRLLQ
ncbi:hypothetical protein [Actinophytocola oryzae]|uniref:hypothetical protein n=1 Tax=Actinophytocola oryzae TaxID=502181 RepID=UPI001415078B|nr:hypothetical protein [Actinophytocola oryzae]